MVEKEYEYDGMQAQLEGLSDYADQVIAQISTV